jgi:pimeloyl-ACP methyl ester carboxylesterase
VTHCIPNTSGPGGSGWTAPRLAAKAAFKLFSTPPRGASERDAETKLHEKLGTLLDDAQPHRIGTPDAFIQAYLWRTSTSPPRGRVLLVHGWTGQALIMGLFVQPLLRAGFEVVAIDLPGHGRSGGRLLNMPIGARALLATADRLGPFDGIVTHSFGGQVAALALEGGPPIGRAIKTGRLVTIAAPNSLQRLARNFGRDLRYPTDLQAQFEARISAAAERPIETINTGVLLATAGCPVLAIHDTQDEEVPFAEAETMAAACPAVKVLAMTGLGHRRIIVTSAVIRAAVKRLTET